MKVETDGPGHFYVDVENVRLTFIPAKDRDNDANWSGKNVIRVQAYRDGTKRHLHMGAELPVPDPSALLALIEGLCLLHRRAADTPNP